jgi:hypothetical protein
MHPSDEHGAAMEMPRYVSHKKVWALEIADVDGCKLTFADKGYAPVVVPVEMYLRYTPVVGDFYVVYADGYKSFSPRKAFLEGYKPDEPNAAELGAALRKRERDLSAAR